MSNISPPPIRGYDHAIHDDLTGITCYYGKHGENLGCRFETRPHTGIIGMETRSAKTGSIGFNFTGGDSGGGIFDAGSFDFGSYLGNFFGDPTGGTGGSTGGNCQTWLNNCALLGIDCEKTVDCDGSGTPISTTQPVRPTTSATVPSGSSGSSNNGNNPLNNILASVLAGLGIVKQIAQPTYTPYSPTGATGIPAGYTLVNGQLVPIGAVPTGAAESLTSGIFGFINANPLITLAIVGGLGLYLLESPRSARNGLLRMIPNPKRHRRATRRRAR